jgi:hypothetical protein
MADAIRFFQQYESVIYFLLALGILFYGWRFYKAWVELRGSIFGLEQVNAQRRLNRSAIAIFVMLLLGVGVFSLVTFAQTVIDSTEAMSALVLPEGEEMQEAGEGTANPDGAENEVSDGTLPTATPLPTVAVDPALCASDSIMITSPAPDQEIRGVVEITGIVNVEDFGFYMFEIARSEEELWLPIQANRTLAPEEATLLEWDSSLFPPGSYVIQLVVTKSNGEEYPPCRIPIKIGNP